MQKRKTRGFVLFRTKARDYKFKNGVFLYNEGKVAGIKSAR